MRILVLSDLHTEFVPFVPTGVGADVVVLAGDTGLGHRGLRWAASAFGDTPVIYVAGNHEYYGRALPKLTNELKTASAGTSVHFLEQGAYRIGAIRFLGCTLWTDFGITGDRPTSMIVCGERMNDFRRIRLSPSFRRLRPADQAAMHAQSVGWLRQELVKDAAATVVITHHAPSRRSLDFTFAGEPINGAYASDLETLVAELQPALWIHGHTHRCVDYRIGRTRVISNQRGYPEEPVVGFDPGLIVPLESDELNGPAS